jgi:phage shock protein PspC (stress-responsive transcriptional regulator)
MNKTVIININGIVFHIEEDAYDILRQYMADVKRHFAYTSDSEEIVSDIENRIAEMFLERLEQEKKQVVVLADVEQVIVQMGSVNDFKENTEDSDTQLPSARTDKKLFRDMDDRIIGGVCAGIGHYFNTEPRWIRAIAILIVFFGGSGLLIYAILWIVIPKAETRADKMAMKGELPNIQNFKRNFDKEIDGLRNNIPDFDPAVRRLKSFFSELFTLLGKILRAIGKFFGGLIVFIGSLTFIAFVIALFAILPSSSANLNTLPFIAINDEYQTAIFLSAFIIAIIPVSALVLVAFRVVFNKKLINRAGSFVLLVIWICSIVMGAYYGTKLASEFKEEASFSETVDIKPSSVYYLLVNDKKFLSKEDSLQFKISADVLSGKTTINNSEQDDSYNLMSLFIERSDVEQPTIVKTYSSQGADFMTGLNLARQINYSFVQNDSLLYFDQRVNLSKGDLWRDQQIKLVLQVPLNTKLIIDDELDRNIRNLDLWKVRSSRTSNKESTEWIMTEDGLISLNSPAPDEKDAF